MNDPITFQQMTAALSAAGEAYEVLPLQNGVSLVVTQRGGRVFGPFLAPDAASLYWTNPALASARTLESFVQAGEWNLGGERFWIAPEIQYNVRDRGDFWGTIAVPPAMDPGSYTLAAQPGGVCLQVAMTLRANTAPPGDKALTLERSIAPVADPLRALRNHADLLDGVTYAGYMQRATLRDTAPDAIMSEAWNLIQLNPGGQLIIPASPALQTTRYFNTVPAEARTVTDGAVRLRITGDVKYKVGYKAAHVTGRIGYFHAPDDGPAYLLVRSFPNNPSTVYIEEPPDDPGDTGDSIHVYNDDGATGGFGEMECHGQTIGGETGQSAQTDTFLLWMYAGPADRLRTIAVHLLGVHLLGVNL